MFRPNRPRKRGRAPRLRRDLQSSPSGVTHRTSTVKSLENVPNRRKVLFGTARFTAELLLAADLDLVIQLNETCSDFFLFQNGLPPGEDDARDVFEHVPPQSTGVTKLPIGIFIPNIWSECWMFCAVIEPTQIGISASCC